MSSALVSSLGNTHMGWQLFKAVAPEHEQVLTLRDDKVMLPVMEILPLLHNPQIPKFKLNRWSDNTKATYQYTDHKIEKEMKKTWGLKLMFNFANMVKSCNISGISWASFS